MSSYAVQHKERAEQLQRFKTRPGRRYADAALSTVLATTPSSYDGRKIAAVDKNIASLDALPDRYASVKTLYVSKNSLRSLQGIEQFADLKALSAADNAIGDLDALSLLPASGIALEAASFEGNPIADLPNYRAHVIHILGPSLAMLDNRAVTAEERRAATGAVAHEATMLSLMLSNACLVHKLGRAVQLVKLHCELQCAVLGGQYGTAAAAVGGGGGAEAVLGSGRGINRVLQLWDYEGSLGRQERHAIGLAIRREVGRRYRKIVLGGGKPEGSSKLWQQAFAQVMLLQQETIASLMKLLEDAKAEAAAAVAPITRPVSPMKRRALASEQEAQGRVRQDREALIHDLRDAFLGLADASAHTNAAQLAAEYEARIRELHAALEAAGGSGASYQQQQEHQKAQAGEGERASAMGGQWAITAMRPEAGQPLSAPVSPAQRQLAAGRLKNTLKQQRPGSTGGWTPARSPARTAALPAHDPGNEATGSAAGHAPGPASAHPAHSSGALLGVHAALPRPGTAPTNVRQQGQQMADQQQLDERRWQADDGLAGYESMEQARCKTPRPFQGSTEQQQQQQQRGSSQTAAGGSRPDLAARESSRHPQPPQLQRPGEVRVQPQLGSGAQHATLAARDAPRSMPRPDSRGGSPLRSRPASPERSRSASPSSQWMPNPLARHSTGGGGSPGAESPRQGGGLQGVFRLLEREGRLNQIEALKSAVVQYETDAAELQATNHELVEALQEAQQEVQGARAQLDDERQQAADQREEAAAQQREAAKQQRRQEQQLLDLGCELEEVMAGRLALQARLEAAGAERQQLVEHAQRQRDAAAAAAQQERQAAAAQVQQLLGRVSELEARKLVHLNLTVASHEAEWRAEAVRPAALEARAGELAARVAADQRQERLGAACSKLAARATLRRILLSWREAAAEHAYLGCMHQEAVTMRHRTLLAAWLFNWRLATQRSMVLKAREQQRQQHLMQLAWQSWRLYCQDCILRRGLDAAASLHRQSTLLQQSFACWRQQAAACQQVELAAQHPAMKAAAYQQRRRLLRTFFGAWRQYMQEHVLPRLAQVQMQLLEQFMGSQRRALEAWKQYAQQRREQHLLTAIAQQHRLRHLLGHWRQAALESKDERATSLRGAITNQLLLLRRGWRSWRLAVQLKRQLAQGMAVAEAHHRQKLLEASWQGWQEWRLVCRGMRQRRAVRLQATALKSWRQAVKAADKRRLADAFHQRCCQRLFRSSLHAWRIVAAAKQQRTHQLAHAQALLRRRLMGRIVAGWRRAVLAGKLCHTLGVVHQLQSAVERVREELQHKAQQVDTLQSVKVTFECQSESLSLQVSSLNADLATAQQQAAELEAAARAAQAEHQAAMAGMKQVTAAAAAAAVERDAAVSGRERAEADRAAACCARQAAEQQAAQAASKADAAALAAAAAVADAAAASGALRSLTQEHTAAKEQLVLLQEERKGMVADLEKALCEVQHTAGVLERLQGERDRLRQQREEAVQGRAAAAAEQAAALKQAERLAALCEEQEQQCRQLQQQVKQLQGMLASQTALQDELAQLAERNQQLHADNQSMQGQLDRFASALEQADICRTSLEQAAEALRGEQQELRAQSKEQEQEARQLVQLADSLQGAKSALERQLAQAQAEAGQAGAERQQLSSAADALQGERERDGLAATAQQLQADKAGLEAAVARLRDQLQQSNGVLDACRQMLGECCSARAAADQSSLTELLRSVKAELLLKDASIKTLTRENAQRAERLQALQAQVAWLSQQVHTSAGTPGGYAQQERYPSAGAAAEAAGAVGAAAGTAGGAATAGPASTASGSGSWTSTSRQSSLDPRAAQPGSPTAGLRMAAAFEAAATPTSGLPYSTLRLDAVAAQAVPASTGSGGSSRASPSGSMDAQQQQDYTRHRFTFSSPAASSPTPSYIPLSSAQQQPWQRAAAPASAHPTLSGGSSSRAPLSPPRPSSSAGAYGSLSRTQPPRPPSSAGSGGGGGAAAAEAEMPASLSSELSDQRLSYLLELVVEKRISATQAQQVINSAAEGDARPLLHVLDAVKRRVEARSSPVPSPPPAAASHVSADELAAVRQQIQDLQRLHGH